MRAPARHTFPSVVDSPMAPHASPLGRCPDCGAGIPAGMLLIEYERTDGLARYAECPDCEAVVRPRSMAR